MGGTTAFYTYTTYMQKFLKLSVGLTDSQTTLVTAGSLVFALILQPIYGALSDRIGRKPLLIWFGVMGTRRHDPAAVRAAGHEERARCVPADRRRVADRGRLHVDQRGREGRALSDEGARDRRRLAVRDHGVDLRRDGRIDRALVQVDRPRDLVLVLPDGRDRDLARRLCRPCAIRSVTRRWADTRDAGTHALRVQAVKTTLILMLTGALLGATIASYVVPPALSWYTAPGGLPQGAQIQAVVQIPEVIQYATSKLIRGQQVGAAIGASVGLVLGMTIGGIRGARYPTQRPARHSPCRTNGNSRGLAATAPRSTTTGGSTRPATAASG